MIFFFFDNTLANNTYFFLFDNTPLADVRCKRILTSNLYLIVIVQVRSSKKCFRQLQAMCASSFWWEETSTQVLVHFNKTVCPFTFGISIFIYISIWYFCVILFSGCSFQLFFLMFLVSLSLSFPLLCLQFCAGLLFLFPFVSFLSVWSQCQAASTLANVWQLFQQIILQYFYNFSSHI